MVIVTNFEVQQIIRKGDTVWIIKSQTLHVRFDSQKDKRTFIITLNGNFLIAHKITKAKLWLQYILLSSPRTDFVTTS